MARYDETIAEFDYDNLLVNYDTCKKFYPCLTEWDITVLLSLLRFGDFPSRWRGSSDNPNGPTSVYLRDAQRNEELSSALGAIETLKARLIMATCESEISEGLQLAAGILGDKLISALSNLAISQSNSQSVSCGGGGAGGYGTGQGTGGAGVNEPEPVPDVDPQGDPPEGYGSWSEYFDDVCAKATWLAGQIEHDLNVMTTAQLVGITILGLAAILGPLLITPLSVGVLAAICGVLVAIAFYGEGALQVVKTSFSQSKADVICALYTASGPSDGKPAAVAAFVATLETETSDPVIRAYGEQLVGLMLSAEGINIVYSKQEGIDYPPGDCGDCSQGSCWYTPPTWSDISGMQVISAVQNPITGYWDYRISSGTSGGEQMVQAEASPAGFSGAGWRVKAIEKVSGTDPYLSQIIGQFTAINDLVNVSPALSGLIDLDIRLMQIRSTGAFTVDMSVEHSCLE